MVAETFDVIVTGGTLIDPAAGRSGRFDIGLRDGRVAAVEPSIPRRHAPRWIDASGKLVVPGLIDTHAHVYEHVTGKFGLDPDHVGVRSGVTTLVDQGGPSCMTIPGFRHYVAERAEAGSSASSPRTSSGGSRATGTPSSTGRTGLTSSTPCGRSRRTATS